MNRLAEKVPNPKVSRWMLFIACLMLLVRHLVASMAADYWTVYDAFTSLSLIFLLKSVRFAHPVGVFAFLVDAFIGFCYIDLVDRVWFGRYWFGINDLIGLCLLPFALYIKHKWEIVKFFANLSKRYDH